jgi:FMN phosphatase YigB (HAD superfamily)
MMSTFTPVDWRDIRLVAFDVDGTLYWQRPLDYPATEKLAAMGLAAHHVVAASDIGLLKPHARGLQSLTAAASTTARETLFVGDRADRDGVAGRRAGVRVFDQVFETY